MRIHDSTGQQRSAGNQRPRVIGLIGPIASGKSTVANRLRMRGADVVDADHVYRALLVPGSELSRRIGDHFGPSVMTTNGEIDRAALGGLVFGNPAALAELDQITHPAIVSEIRTLIDQSTAPVVVIEAVKLVQSGLAKDVDSLWLVTADEETRLKRLVNGRGMDESSARDRIRATRDVVPKGLRVDVSIENSGDLNTTLYAVDEAWHALLSDTTQKRHDLVVSQHEEIL